MFGNFLCHTFSFCVWKKQSVTNVGVQEIMVSQFRMYFFHALYRLQTALHKAAWYGYQSICEILVNKGASLTRKDYQVNMF